MILPLARDCADAVSNSSTSNAYLILALNQIGTALTSGNRNCTLTVSGKQGADVMAVEKTLASLGYTLSQSGSTLTISWANA